MKRNCLISKIIVLLLINSLSVFSQSAENEGLWRFVSTSEISNGLERYAFPSSYKTAKLDLTSTKLILSKAPKEFTIVPSKSPIVLSIPMPDGTFQRFGIVETEIMHPLLAAQFPNFKVYSGQGIENKASILKISITDLGFQAMIISPSGSVFIDPFHQFNTQDYIIYNKKDLKPYGSFVCETEELKKSLPFNSTVNSQNLRVHGTQLRTYRLALACTGEYAGYYGGTVSGALSGMIASMLRVNGVYETEVAVRMILIPNTTSIIYTNGATDPYTNNNGSTMLTENQTNLNNVIGTANYDIGHVFSTGGGGVAVLNSPCGTSKARGVTGLGSPVGDAFDIDYVAHEMGHQFGGSHTFNSSLGSCTSNRTVSAAFEPGSGVTIMAYAGICGTDNLASNSIAYFHVYSFDQIFTFTTTGSGNGCSVKTNTGNTPPTLSSTGTGYNIPLQTPFYLTAAGSDVDGDAITYSWEEYDLGAQGVWTAPVGDAPIFRSFNPTISPIRIFPKMQDLVRNVTTIGELLPTYARTLKFKVTARDNRAGGGGINRIDDTVRVNVINTTTPFKVTVPNTNLTWITGTSQTITWDIASSNLSPINCANVKISLSLDSGYTYPVTILASTANDGSEIITVPNFTSNKARIKVEAVGNIFFDISDVNFSITPGSPVLTNLYMDPLSTSTLCSGQTFNVSFSGDGPANAGNTYRVELSNSSGSFVAPTTIGTLNSTSSSGLINCTLPVITTNTSGFLLRVVSSNPSVIGSNNGTVLTINSPVGTAGAITGLTTFCEGTTGIVYSISPITNATSYKWVLPTGLTIITGATTNSITVNSLLGSLSGNVTVTPSNSCGNGIASSLAITINPLPTITGLISGPTGVCKGSTVTYSVALNPSVVTYNWTFPSGFSVVSGLNTNTLVLSVNASAVSGVIAVSGTNGCGTRGNLSINVIVQDLPVTPIISAASSTTICPIGSVLLSSSITTGVSYQWRNNGIDILNATSQTYTATTSGNYDVVVKDLVIPKQTFTTNKRDSIPDNSCVGATSKITVSGYTGKIDPSKIFISINITHTYVGDLAFYLESPSGSRLGLSNQTGNTGNSGDNFTNTVFADSGLAQIPTSGAPYSGLYKPWGSIFTVPGCSFTTTLTSFAGFGTGVGNINPNGDWTLRAFDRFGTDTGSVVNWQITFPSFTPLCSVNSNVINVNVVPKPIITSFLPISGAEGSTVVINGSNFNGVTSVKFNGISAVSYSVISSNQLSVVVPNGASTGLITVAIGGCEVASVSNFTVVASAQLNLKVFIEGFYQNAGTMVALVNSTICDTITVELRSPATPFLLQYSIIGTINSSGNGVFTFPGNVIGNNYYIVVKHRNAITTWSKNPVLFSALTTFDFTN